jgi:type I restriction enzyme, S subunit
MKELITANLDIWSAAVTAKTSGAGRSSGNKGAYGINKLRELILELAVRGKLMPQDPRDEPARELLNKIRKEKEKLIADGKIKKDKPLPPIADGETSFALPKGWEWVRFCDYALDIATGPFGSMIHQADYVEGGVPLINPSHMIDDQIFPDMDISVSEEMAKRLESYVLFGGDIVMARRGEVGRIALVTKKESGWLCGTGSFVLRFGSVVFRDYLKVIFRCESIRKYLAGEAVGMTMVNLNHGILKKMPFALPPLAEQHRIVSKVDELMALCDQLETEQDISAERHEKLVSILLDALTQGDNLPESWIRVQEHFDVLFTTPASIDKLKQTLLQLAVMGKLVPQDPNDEPASELSKRAHAAKQNQLVKGSIRKQKELLPGGLQPPPYEVPDGWEWQNMDDLFVITGGVTLGRKLTGQKLVSKPYLRVANVQRGTLDLDHIKEIDVQITEVEKYALNRGDLLITEGGDWDKVGRTAIWNNELPECLHQNHVFRVRPVLSDWVSRWSELYLNSTTARDYFAGSSKQTTNLASINMTQLRGCAFALPPLQEQHRIVAKVDELMALCDQLKTQLAQAGDQQIKLADVMVERAVA